MLDAIDAKVTDDGGVFSFPAVNALAKLGEPVIPKVIAFIDATNDPMKRELAVQVIVRIKGRGYDKYVRSQWDFLPPATREALVRYGIRE